MAEGLVRGDDGLARCGWADAPPDYREYHDGEWGRPVRGDDALFERITLEAFQSGLSWLTILRKRAAFRRAFDGFAVGTVAGYGPTDVDRLLADPGIVRNRAKIEAAITNARAAVALPDGLTALVWAHQPMTSRPAPVGLADVPASTPESTALAKELKRRGFRFVGPTTAYAAMQACGVVNDHLVGCHARGHGVEVVGDPGDEPVEVLPADDPRVVAAAAAFPAVAAAVRQALGAALVRVDHVGSTAVPGLAAKPVLDVQVSVPDVADEAAYVRQIEGALGVVLRAREPGHRYLRPRAGAPRTMHVHVCEAGSRWERDHLLFAAYLRADPVAREGYAALKQRLADRHRDQRLAYTEGKSRFVAGTLADAERWADRVGWRP